MSFDNATVKSALSPIHPAAGQLVPGLERPDMLLTVAGGLGVHGPDNLRAVASVAGPMRDTGFRPAKAMRRAVRVAHLGRLIGDVSDRRDASKAQGAGGRDVTDPIFAAIEAHRAAAQLLERANKPYGRIMESCPRARIQIGEYRDHDIEINPNDRGGKTIVSFPTEKTVPLFATDRVDLRRNAPDGLDADQTNAWIEERFVEIEAEQERLDAEWFATEPGKLHRAWLDAYDVERDRIWDLIWTTPTTMAGLVALLAYMRERESINEVVHDDIWEDALEWTIECATCELAGLPKPPMSEEVEELWMSTQDEGSN